MGKHKKQKAKDKKQAKDMKAAPVASHAKRLQNLPKYVSGIRSGDTVKQLESVTWLRKLLAGCGDSLAGILDQVIPTGVVPRLVELMGDGETPELQAECAWVLTNVTSGAWRDISAAAAAAAAAAAGCGCRPPLLPPPLLASLLLPPAPAPAPALLLLPPAPAFLLLPLRRGCCA